MEVRGKQNDKRKKKCAKAAAKKREQAQANTFEQKLIEVVKTAGQGGNSHNESVFQVSTVSKSMKGLKLKANKKLVLKPTSSPSSPGKSPISAKRLAKVLSRKELLSQFQRKRDRMKRDKISQRRSQPE